ncbi:MAG: hypothetical protein GY940_16960, partial [bacterium]|nr:hypothetical protein [bacterium]
SKSGAADEVSPLRANRGKLKNLGTIPLYFIPNQGQVNGKVRFYAKTPGYTLWATRKGLAFSRAYKKNNRFYNDVSRLVFMGANKKPRITAEKTTDHRVSYFIGNDPSKWKTNIPTSTAVLYKDLYKSIDLKVYGVQKQVEYDWIVQPGGDTRQICFKYKNVKKTGIDPQGNLLIETESGTLAHKKPVSYQMIDGKRVDVTAFFVKRGQNKYGLQVGRYDKAYQLVIDPLVLVHGTYVGGKYDDTVEDMTVDNKGNVYMVGTTVSGSFPLKNPYQQAGEVYVLKMHIASDGQSTLKFSTYIGSRYFPAVYDHGYGIAVDSAGMIYVAGTTRSTRFPVKNYWQKNLRGYSDAFVVKF